MEFERGNLVSPVSEVPVVEGELVTAIREQAGRGWGSKAIARELSVARNTVHHAAGRASYLLLPVVGSPHPPLSRTV